MLPETLLVPTSSYLAFISIPRRPRPTVASFGTIGLNGGAEPDQVERAARRVHDGKARMARIVSLPVMMVISTS
jgi:hypothetical protein